jgi:hypothetical protein
MSIPIDGESHNYISINQQKSLKEGAYKGFKINWISKNLNKGTCTCKDNMITFTYNNSKKKPITINLTEVDQKNTTLSRVIHELKWKIKEKLSKKFENRIESFINSINSLPSDNALPYEKKINTSGHLPAESHGKNTDPLSSNPSSVKKENPSFDSSLPQISKESKLQSHLSSQYKNPSMPQSKLISEADLPLPSPNPASDKEVQTIKTMIADFEGASPDSNEFENYLKSKEIIIDELSLPNIKRLFATPGLEIPLVLFLQKTQNKTLLDKHLKFRVEKFIELHKNAPKNLILDSAVQMPQMC